jgi:hypothetical protein
VNVSVGLNTIKLAGNALYEVKRGMMFPIRPYMVQYIQRNRLQLAVSLLWTGIIAGPTVSSE